MSTSWTNDNQVRSHTVLETSFTSVPSPSSKIKMAENTSAIRDELRERARVIQVTNQPMWTTGCEDTRLRPTQSPQPTLARLAAPGSAGARPACEHGKLTPPCLGALQSAFLQAGTIRPSPSLQLSQFGSSDPSSKGAS